jgi:hypothetical protein
LRAQGTHRDAVHARALITSLADLAGVVGSPERADHELAGLDRLDLRADLLDDPDVLVTHPAGHARSSTPRYGHRSEPQTHAADT